MKKIIEYFGGEKRFYLIMAFLFIMWLGIMTLFYLKADEVTKNPCSICAKKLQEEVICTAGDKGQIIKRIYYPNFSIKDSINSFP